MISELSQVLRAASVFEYWQELTGKAPPMPMSRGRVRAIEQVRLPSGVPVRVTILIEVGVDPRYNLRVHCAGR